MSRIVTEKNRVWERKGARKQGRERKEEEERGMKGKQFFHGNSFSGSKKTTKKTLKKLREK